MNTKILLKSSLQIFEHNVWQHHIPVPKQIGDLFVEGNNRRIAWHIDGKKLVNSALMPYKKGYFILINKTLCKKMHLEKGQPLQITIEKDTSQYGHIMPESLNVLLEQHNKVKEYFSSLSMGKQRSLIYIVKKVKNFDSQMAKCMAIVHHLEESKGNLCFKRLQELIKIYNGKKDVFS